MTLLPRGLAEMSFSKLKFNGDIMWSRYFSAVYSIKIIYYIYIYWLDTSLYIQQYWYKYWFVVQKIILIFQALFII